VLIPKTIQRRLIELCEKFDCPGPLLERVALTEEQIEQFNLPTRPTKREGNRHANKFEGDSVELDALPASTLRDMAREVIERHITIGVLTALRAAENSEREQLKMWADQVEADDAYGG